MITVLLLAAAGGVLSYLGEPIFWPGFVAIALFYGLIFFIGALAAQREGGDTTESLLLASRGIPLWMGAFTMSATWVGGGYINGTAESTAGSGLAWVQAPWGYALSLVLGGLFFAGPMRRKKYTTLLDPLSEKYGEKHAAVLFLVALSGELFWTAAILTALGTTFGTVIGVDFTTAIIISAVVAVAYTSLGGLWAVASTDVLQLLILVVGLWLVVPVVLDSSHGWTATWQTYQQNVGWQFPSGRAAWQWWDYALLLVFGGIPWQVYFQRVLSARDESAAKNLSFIAAIVCLIAAVPAVIIGMVGAVTDWQAMGLAPPDSPALVLPHVLRYLTNPWIAAIGLGALSAAVMSSVDSSILSASTMAVWNVYRPLFHPDAPPEKLARSVRLAVLILGFVATLVALKVKSVYALWFLCSDFVYCMLLAQLTTALFDPRANRTGAIAGLVVSFVLRFGGGEATLGIPQLIPYPFPEFPFRTLSMVCGLITIIVVSRLFSDKGPKE
jgi:high affinity choline transporter 7